MGRIVAGVDGSPESVAALRFAVEEARLRGAQLEALYAYEPEQEQSPYSVAYSTAYLGNPPGIESELHEWAEKRAEQARSIADDTLRRIVESLGADAAGVEIVRRVTLDDHPAKALVEASRGADMLVVGSRGRGGFTGLILGSVSQQAAHHATCPVVIVHPKS